MKIYCVTNIFDEQIFDNETTALLKLFEICGEIHIGGELRDLLPFVQFKKHEKHPWKSVNFSKVAG